MDKNFKLAAIYEKGVLHTATYRCLSHCNVSVSLSVTPWNI